MEAFHSFWSVPNRCRHGGSISIRSHEQLTAILSALEWQKHNGSIRMITDSSGKEYFEGIGLSPVWNGIEVYPDDMEEHVDPFLFWAAGKLRALRQMDTPCVMLDTDLIIWKNIDAVTTDFAVTAAHREELNGEVYPDPHGFAFKEGYSFPDKWDFSLQAANTAFLCIRDSSFKYAYLDAAESFIENVKPDGLDPVKAMCFAEQRVLPMCADSYGVRLGFLMSNDELDSQELATHTWGFKQILDTLPEANHQFCMRCVKHIAEDFPDRLEMLKECRDLRIYYEEYVQYNGENM